MSALAGILHFDPRRPVEPAILQQITAGIDRLGPDGGDHYLAQQVGLVYRAFHTTPEAARERQPLEKEGVVMTWDGRLDNREEIRSKLAPCDLPDLPTDVDLVMAAYLQFDTKCLADLLGDWAIVVWDARSQRLILSRDAMGVRRLFVRQDREGITWCTSLEPLVLTAATKLHVDLEYLEGCLQPRPPVEATAYEEIRALIPGTFIVYQRGKRSTESYWSVSSQRKIRHASDADYEANFREVFALAIRRRLRSDGLLLAELSGGIDSSSIVCVADDILETEGGPKLETFSYFDPVNPGGDERPYFSLIERRRGRAGHHLSLADFDRQIADRKLLPLPDDEFAASPGYSLRSLQWDRCLQEVRTRTGTRVCLSGVGGDEVLGGVPYAAPEFADLLRAGKLIALAGSLLRWSLASRRPIVQLLREMGEMLLAPYRKLEGPGHSAPPWLLARSVSRSDSYQSFAPWRQLPPAKLHMERIRYTLASQLTCVDPPLVGCVEMRYPYLDRTLFSFLASIPRSQVLGPGRRRHLMRRALRGIVPALVLERPTKWFGARSMLALFEGQEKFLEELFATPWISDSWLVDQKAVRQLANQVLEGTATEGMPLLSILGVEQWLRSQNRANRIDLNFL